MPNINAALGLAQLEQLDNFLASKREIAKQYKQYFNSLQWSFLMNLHTQLLIIG